MGSSKKQTVGFRYRMGLHMGVALRCDAMLEIKVGDRSAWRGLVNGSRAISIYAPNLFGGDEREGGVQGALDVMMGEEDQGPNAYLTAQQGGFQPGYRGFMGLVFRGLITSNNPYIKNWAVRCRSILEGWHGDEAWYPAKAPISLGIRSVAVVIALDCSGSMNEITSNGQTRAYNAKVAISGVLDFIAGRLGNDRVDLMGVGWGASASTNTYRNASVANVNSLKAWFNGIGTNQAQTDFAFATASASAFYAGGPPGAQKIFIFITDGEPSREGLPFPLPESDAINVCQGAADALFSTSGVQSYGFNIDLTNTDWTSFLDNTPADGVPVIDGADSDALQQAVAGAIGGALGMNPAHIVYQALTDPDWGMGYPAELIDEDSFAEAADVLYNEGFGLTLKWVNQSSVRAFTQTIADHASLNYGQSRTTGKFEIQLLRQDYVIADLPVFNKKNARLVKYQRPSLTDTVNEIIIGYTDIETGEDASTAPIQNLANIQAQGRIVSQKLSFPGLPTNSLATRVGMRELQSRSTPLWKMTLAFHRGEATKLKAGKPFVADFLDTELGVRVVLRAVEINFGTTVDAEIVAECVEDVFGMPDATYVGNPAPPPEPPDTSPKPAIAQVFELPYREVLQGLGAAETGSLPADAGYVGAAAVRPAGVPLNFSLNTRIAPNDYAEAGQGDFCPSALSAAIIPREAGPTVVAYTSPSNIATLEVGTAVWLGDNPGAEMGRVEALATGAATITIARGCGDTIPKEWPAGTRIWGFDAFIAFDPEQYVDGEQVDTKITTNATGGSQSIVTATPRPVVMDSRLARPYPPGKFKVNGLDYPDEVFGDIVVSWSHRDRLLQADTLIDTTADSIGPEPGSTYSLAFYLNDGTVPVHSEAALTGTTFTWTPPAAGVYRIELATVRDAIESWQRYVHKVDTGGALWTPANLLTPAKFWFSDQSPITEVSGLISQANDLSPSGFNVTQGSSSARPARVPNVQNGLPVYRFDGGDRLVGPSGGDAVKMLSGIAEAWAIVVYKSSSTSSGNRYLMGITATSGNNARFLSVNSSTTGGTYTNRPGVGGRSNTSDNYSEMRSATAVGTNWTMALHQINYPTKTGIVHVNGGTAESATMANMTAANSQALDQAPFVVGGDNQNLFNGDIGEILFGVGVLPPEEIDRLFGYLAWKWGLVAQLPSGHPYKSAPPTVEDEE